MNIIVQILFFLFFSSFTLFCQIRFSEKLISTSSLDELEIDFKFTNINEDVESRFHLQLSNPSILYFTSLSENPNVISSEVIPLGDGQFSVYILGKKSLTTFSIKAKPLSGIENKTNIKLLNLNINSKVFPDDSAIYIFEINKLNGPYIRLLSSSYPYPNPVSRGEKIKMDLFNDISTEVRVLICNINGKVIIDKNNYFEKGRNNIEFKTEDFSIGTYFVFLYSKIGLTTKQFEVIK